VRCPYHPAPWPPRTPCSTSSKRCRSGGVARSTSTAWRPDAGFSQRLRDLSEACAAEAEVCRRAATAGWPAAGKDRRQPAPRATSRHRPSRARALWRRFDAAVAVLTRAAATTDLIAVADAYELLSEAAADLAEAVEQQDRASGLLPAARSRQRTA